MPTRRQPDPEPADEAKPRTLRVDAEGYVQDGQERVFVGLSLVGALVTLKDAPAAPSAPQDAPEPPEGEEPAP
jgi:hypothetical protein